MNLQQLVDSQPHLSTQRPHAAGEHIPKPGQPRQTGSHRSAVGKQRIEHLSHSAPCTDQHRLIGRLPIKTFEVGLNIHRPVVGGGGARCGATPTES